MNIKEHLLQIWDKNKNVDKKLYERGFALCIDPIKNYSVFCRLIIRIVAKRKIHRSKLKD